jgi:hypothetical protein
VTALRHNNSANAKKRPKMTAAGLETFGIASDFQIDSWLELTELQGIPDWSPAANPVTIAICFLPPPRNPTPLNLD